MFGVISCILLLVALFMLGLVIYKLKRYKRKKSPLIERIIVLTTVLALVGTALSLVFDYHEFQLNSKSTEEQKRVLIRRIISEITENNNILVILFQLPGDEHIHNFQFLTTDAWDSIINKGWLGLFEDDQLVDKLKKYYSNIRQIKCNLQNISYTPDRIIVDKKNIAEAKRLAKINLENSPVILKQLEELLNSL